MLKNNDSKTYQKIGTISGLNLGSAATTAFTLLPGVTLATFCPTDAVVSYASGTVAIGTTVRGVSGATVIGGLAVLTGLASGKIVPTTILEVGGLIDLTAAWGMEVVTQSGTAATANVTLYGVRL